MYFLFKKRNFYYVFLLLFASFLKAQNTNIVQVDSITANGVLKIKTPKSIFLEDQEDDISFYINNCKSIDSIVFLWEGIDKRPVFWHNNEIRYTGIKGGKYTFFLMQKKLGKLDTLSILPISVKATITEGYLFFPSLIFAIISFLVAIIYLWLSYNTRQRKNVEYLRNQIAGDLHDEVGSTLSSIAILSKVLRRNLQEKIPESLPVLDKILTSSKETIINLRDAVWTINPANDSFEKLMAKMHSFAHEMLVGEDIELQYRSIFEQKPKLCKGLKISMEQRRHVYLMFKECVHNIVKHSDATEVKIDVDLKPDGVLFCLKDNGKGFDMVQTTEGNGLMNLRRRAADCFIDLEIKSAPKQGTIIKMLIPEL